MLTLREETQRALIAKNWDDLKAIGERLHGKFEEQSVKNYLNFLNNLIIRKFRTAAEHNHNESEALIAAQKLCQLILQIKPDDVATIARLAYCESALADLESDAKVAEEGYNKAWALYDRALEMGPRDGSIRGSKAGFLLSLAHNTDWAERRNDLIKDALVLCREAVTAPEPYYHFQTWRETLTWIDELAEEYPQEWREQAWREYDQTFDELKLNPQAISSWAGALVRLGSYWVEIGKNEQAIELFREALAKLRHLSTLGPATPRVHIKAAQNLEAIVLFLDDEEEPIIELALQHYQKAIELDPEDPFAYIQTAQCWERLSRVRKDITILDQAIATYRKGLEHGIVDYQFFVDFGRILYKRVAESQEVPNRQELLRQAIDVFMRALILNFDCDLAPYNILARCFAELGKVQRALKTLNLGLMLFWRVADFRKYHEHPMWARLRQHPDFLELIAGYEARDITRYSQWERRYEKMLDKLRLQINQLTERTIANEELEETLDAFAKLATSYPSRLQLADALLEYLPLAEPGKRDSLASQALDLYTQLSVEDPHLLPNPWIGAIRVCRLTGQKETADQMDQQFRKIFAEEVDFSFVDKLLDETL